MLAMSVVSTDIANIQQLTLCDRFYDSSTKTMREEFLQFVSVSVATGEGLAKQILESLRDF